MAAPYSLKGASLRESIKHRDVRHWEDTDQAAEVDIEQIMPYIASLIPEDRLAMRFDHLAIRENLRLGSPDHQRGTYHRALRRV